MSYLLNATIVLPIIYILYLFLRSFLESQNNARKAQELGALPPPKRQNKYPGSIDFVSAITKADKEHKVPNYLETVFESMNRAGTWQQNLFFQRYIFTVDPKNIQAILATQFHNFSLGPARQGSFQPLLGTGGIFTSNGKIWEHSRALLRPQFARDNVSNLELEEVHVQDMLKHLPVDGSGWTAEVNLQPLFFRLTLDSATEFLFGQSVHSQIFALPADAIEKRDMSNPSGLDLLQVANAFDASTDSLGQRARRGDLYWLYNPQSFRDNCSLVHRFADYFVNMALTMDPNEIEAGEKKQYVFLRELAKSTRDPLELRSQLLNILLAGRDTTAGLLGWTFWELARHPDVFNRLRQTIVEDFGTFKNPKNIIFSTLKSCKYLQHVMNETLRLFPNVPVNSRYAIKDTSLPRGGGPDGLSPIFIPAGTSVDYSVYVMHRRTDLWGPDAKLFNPDRFQNRKTGWEYLPFNGGPRICLGQQFALTEAGYVIVRLLQKYDRIENLDTISEADPEHQYSVTSAPWAVPLRLHEADE